MSRYPRFYPDQVIPPDRFGDREDQRRQIDYTLNAIGEGRPRGAMICGERGIGKSSLLDKAKSMCLEKEMLPIFLGLHEFKEDREFYDTIFEEIGDALKEIGLWEKLRGMLREFDKEWNYIIRLKRQPKTLQGEVSERFELLLKKMQGRGYRACVFLMDESDGLKKHMVALQILRNVWTSLCRKGFHLGFLFAGSENLVEKLGHYSPLKRHCVPIHLKRFTMGECLKVIQRLEEGYDPFLTGNIRTSISALSGGYPHFIHVIGSYVIDAIRRGKIDIWLEALKNYLLELNEYEKVLVKSRKISGTQKEILLAMDPFVAETPKIIGKKCGVPNTSITPQLNRLLKNKAVKRIGRGDYEIADRSLVEVLKIPEGKW